MSKKYLFITLLLLSCSNHLRDNVMDPASNNHPGYFLRVEVDSAFTTSLDTVIIDTVVSVSDTLLKIKDSCTVYGNDRWGNPICIHNELITVVEVEYDTVISRDTLPLTRIGDTACFICSVPEGISYDEIVWDFNQDGQGDTVGSNLLNICWRFDGAGVQKVRATIVLAQQDRVTDSTKIVITE